MGVGDGEEEEQRPPKSWGCFYKCCWSCAPAHQEAPVATRHKGVARDSILSKDLRPPQSSSPICPRGQCLPSLPFLLQCLPPPSFLPCIVYVTAQFFASPTPSDGHGCGIFVQLKEPNLRRYASDSQPW